MGLHNFGKIRIPFEYHGNILKLYVSKYSTCKDVIHMILHKSGVSVSDVNSFGVFEKTNRAERLLSENTLVYKIWHSWGSEKTHFKFIIKSKDTKLRMESDKHLSRPKSVECDIDSLYKNHYSKINNVNDLECDTFVTENMETPSSTTSRKDSHRTNTRQLDGKQMVLARYLHDVLTTSTKKLRRSQNELSILEGGDGRDDKTSECCRSVKCRNGRRLKYPTYKSNNEGKADPETELDATPTLEFYDGQVTLDTAFVKSSCDSDSDEGIDVTSVDSIDLDAAFIAEKASYNDYIELDRIEVANATSHSDESNVNLIKRLFTGDQFEVSEDDAMESFMHSRIEYH